MKSFDVLIVGAGIVGCACARECAQAGLHVGLVDGHPPGTGATGAGMGHLVVMDDSPAQLALTHLSRSLWRELIPQLPSPVEYESRGTLWLAADDEEMAEVYAKHAAYSAAGVLCEVLDAIQLAAAEPNLRPGLAGALCVPDDGILYPPAAARFFLAQAQAMGAACVFGSEAVSASNGELRLDNGTTLQADRIVLATGASSTLLPALPLKRRKGHLAITDRYPGFLHHQLVELGYLKSAHGPQTESVAFNVQPRRTGQILIGSARQHNQDHSSIDGAVLTRMLARAERYMPALASLSVLRVWTGFRAATPDNLPLIGPATGLSQDKNLWLAVGFEGLGITNAPGAARLLVDQLLHRDATMACGPYLPQRIADQEYSHA